MGNHLKLGGIELGRFITENRFSVEEKPVYDEAGSFVNIYGEKVRERTGRQVTVTAVLSDVDDATAEALSAVLAAGKVQAEYSAPEVRSSVMETVRQKMSLDRVYMGERFWTAELELCGYVRECL